MASDAIDIQLGGTVSVATGGELDLNGALTSFVGLTVAGGGKVVLGGSSANTYIGTTTVDGSTLVLGNPGGAVAVPANLVIGDGNYRRGHGAGDRRRRPDRQHDRRDRQDSPYAFELNGNNDAIGALTLTGATVTTGTGTLTLGGDVTANDDGHRGCILDQWRPGPGRSGADLHHLGAHCRHDPRRRPVHPGCNQRLHGGHHLHRRR